MDSLSGNSSDSDVFFIKKAWCNVNTKWRKNGKKSRIDDAADSSFDYIDNKLCHNPAFAVQAQFERANPGSNLPQLCYFEGN